MLKHLLGERVNQLLQFCSSIPNQTKVRGKKLAKEEVSKISPSPSHSLPQRTPDAKARGLLHQANMAVTGRGLIAAPEAGLSPVFRRFLARTATYSATQRVTAGSKSEAIAWKNPITRVDWGARLHRFSQPGMC